MKSWISGTSRWKSSSGREFKYWRPKHRTPVRMSRPARFTFPMTFDVNKHILVPKHSKISDAEKEKLLQVYNVTIKELPKIYKADAALAKIDTKAGDIIKIERESKTAGTSAYYRVVVEG